MRFKSFLGLSLFCLISLSGCLNVFEAKEAHSIEEIKALISNPNNAFVLSGEARDSLLLNSNHPFGLTLTIANRFNLVCVTDSDLIAAAKIAPSLVAVSDTSTAVEDKIVVAPVRAIKDEVSQKIAQDAIDAFNGVLNHRPVGLFRCPPVVEQCSCPAGQTLSGGQWNNSFSNLTTCQAKVDCDEYHVSCGTEGCFEMYQYGIDPTTGQCALINEFDHGTVCSMGCLAPKTAIQIENNKTKEIKDIKVGEKLWNPLTKQYVEVKRVINGVDWASTYELSFGSTNLIATGNHPFMVNHKVVTANELNLGDKTQDKDGRTIVLTAKKLLPKGQRTFNIELKGPPSEKAHFFSANGIATGDLYLQERNDKLKTPLN